MCNFPSFFTLYIVGTVENQGENRDYSEESGKQEEICCHLDSYEKLASNYNNNNNNIKIYGIFCSFKLQNEIDPIYPTPPLGQDVTQGKFFKRSLTGLNSEFSFPRTSCLTKAEEPSLSYYLPLAGGRIIGFIPFPRVSVLCEMQSVSSRI